MEIKSILVSVLAICLVAILAGNVSALVDSGSVLVYVDGVPSYSWASNSVSVTPGEVVDIKVVFVADENAENVRIKAEISGEDEDSEARTGKFDIIDGRVYKKYLKLQVPSELDDEIVDDYELEIKIWNKDGSYSDSFDLTVQRESFKLEIMSIDVPQAIDVGNELPVDIVLKNVGSHDLDDLYVTVSIPALNLERRAYFDDLAPLEDLDCDWPYDEALDPSLDCSDGDNDEDDTVSGRISLQIPSDAENGIYALEVEASNDDTSVSETTQIVIENEFSGREVIPRTTGKTFSVGEKAEYELLIVNPTNKLKVYRVIPESSGELSVSTSESVVAVSPGSSKTVTVIASAISEGTYDFNVNVFEGEELLSTVQLNANVEGRALANPIVVLTIVLAIIFIVLLIVLVTLLSRKPEKPEEFGESYY